MTDELERPAEADAESPAAADPPDAADGDAHDDGGAADADPDADATDESATDAVSAEEPAVSATVPTNTGDASLLALIDRLGGMLERSDMTELEIEVGGTALILRKAAIPQPVAIAAGVDALAAGASVPTSAPSGASTADQIGAPSRPSIKAPLTGIWYGSPAPGSAPFVEVGREVAIGQVVGMIEAMKLFNEIKSELAGKVLRVVPESGALVKAKQPLIEVDPL